MALRFVAPVYSPVAQAAQQGLPSWLVLLIIVVVVLILLWLFARWFASRGKAPATPATRAEVFTPTASKEDDLTLIEGIGPKINNILKAGGVTTFAQLAAMTPDEIMRMIQAQGIRLADPASWPEQARLAANGDMAGLKALQDQLVAGRKS